MRFISVMVIFLLVSLMASAEPIAIGGDFGRTWLNNFLANNPSPFSQDNNSSSANWGNAPKVQGTMNSNMVSKQNATNLIKPSSNWLADTTNAGPSSPQNFTQVPFFIDGYSKPVHAMDASFNHSAQIPVPDANGLIHGWDAETYDAIGPALDYF